jgi:hypothetical protein
MVQGYINGAAGKDARRLYNALKGAPWNYKPKLLIFHLHSSCHGMGIYPDSFLLIH